jgi:hypothetical protein
MLVSQLSPWKDMKRVLLDKTTGVKIRDFLSTDSETKDWGATEWINSNYDVFVEIPKYYYSSSRTPSLTPVYITTHPLPGFQIHPAFERPDGIRDYVYYGAFEGYIDASGMLRSIPYVQPTTEKTIAEFRAAAKAEGRAEGFQLQNMYLRQAVALLFFTEFGNLNSQAVLSQGITNLENGTENHSQNTGKTLPLNNDSGQIIQTTLENGATFQTGETATYPFSYRGIENLWGNIWEFVDGCMKTSDGLYFDIENDETTPSNMKEFYSMADVSTFTTGYSDKVDERIGWGIIPKYSFNGSSSSYLSDYLGVGTGTRIARVGADWNYGLIAGLSALRLHSVPSDSTRNVGARLAKF